MSNDTNGPNHQALVDIGRAKIAWAKNHSPVLGSFVFKHLNDGTLRNKRIAVVVHLEAKTAYLATLLANAGANVVAAGSNPATTDGAVVAALRDAGIHVVSDAGSDLATWERELHRAADFEPDYVIDDGAELTARIGKYRPDVFQSLKGVSEQTTTGTARLYALEHAGKLPFPALTANNARCKHMFDNRYGTGQTTLQAVLRLSGRRLAGSKIAVIGYGYVGRGIAEYAAKLHARVMVIEVDPVRALEAHMDGHHVGTAHDVLPHAEFVITATGGIRALARQDFSLLTHDVILANAGHHDLEIDVDALSNAADTISHPSPDTTTYTLGTRDVHVLCNGALVNIAGGSGHPVEIMDLSFAVQGIGAHYLINTPLDPGVHVLPKVLDDAIARSKLESLGVTLAQPRPEQVDRHDGLIDEIEL